MKKLVLYLSLAYTLSMFAQEVEAQKEWNKIVLETSRNIEISANRTTNAIITIGGSQGR